MNKCVLLVWLELAASAALVPLVPMIIIHLYPQCLPDAPLQLVTHLSRFCWRPTSQVRLNIRWWLHLCHPHFPFNWVSWYYQASWTCVQPTSAQLSSFSSRPPRAGQCSTCILIVRKCLQNLPKTTIVSNLDMKKINNTPAFNWRRYGTEYHMYSLQFRNCATQYPQFSKETILWPS